MALTTVTLHGQILRPVVGTPAVGTVYFRILTELRDLVANIVYSPQTFSAVLNGTGEFTLVLPATDNPDLEPASWVYQVQVDTDVWDSVFYVQLPFTVGTAQLADLEQLAFDPCTGMAVPGVPIAPEDGDLFVRKAGDTMTGPLVINSNLQVNGTMGGVYQGVTGDVMRLLSSTISTGVASGGDLSPNVDPTKLDITATAGWIVDYNSSGIISATNPKITYVSLPTQTALVPSVGVPNGTTWWLVNSAGTLIQQATIPTSTQRRTHMVLGATAQAGGVIVTAQSLPSILSQPANQLGDLIDSLGGFRISGGVISPNGVNLNINLSAGKLFVRAFSQIPDYQDPHHAELLAETPMQFRHVTGVLGGAGALTSTLNVGSYDPGGLGVVTPVGGGANTATNFRVWAFGTETPTTQILVQYGQNTYATLALAQAAIGATQFTVNPTAAAAGVLIGWISVIRTATNLSDPTQAIFVSTAGKFSTP